MNAKVLPIVATAILGLSAMSIIHTHPQAAVNPPPSPPPRSTFEQRVAAVGLVEARSENISIASHLPGVVDKVYVTAGQEVKRGDPLVKLDTRALESLRAERSAAVETARAQVRKARAELADRQNNLRFAQAVGDSRSISVEELTRRQTAVGISEAEVASAEAGVSAAVASLKTVETDLERSIVTAPMAGRILQVRIRPGEFAPAGPSGSPWLMMGDVSSLHIRVDIDEHEAWRVQPGAPAIAEVRGNSSLRARAQFVRFEPYVLPKQSLTGASTERVDTRVLQAIYRVESSDVSLFVGQQMDVFIEATGTRIASLIR
jgi:RND family efflux transporter MFP subunit